MPSRPTGDAWLKGPDWERVKAWWRQQAQPCSLCGTQIIYRPDYRGPRSLHVGHIVSRDEARTLGWTRAQTNDIHNTRPECRRCSTTGGARYGNAKRSRHPIGPALELDDW